MSKADIESIDFLDPSTQSCPYEAYKTLRDECPVYKIPEVGSYMITKYDDARNILTNPKTFSSTFPPQDRPLSEGMKKHADILNVYGLGRTGTLQRLDPPMHTTYRKLLNKAFTAKRMREIQPYIDKVVNDLIDKFIDGGSCEFVNEFAVPIPCTIIADQLGVSREYLPKLKAWSDAMLLPASMMATTEEMEEAALLEVEAQHYFAEVFEEKRHNPTDDIISELVNLDFEGARKLTDPELQDLMHQLLTGGNETTTSSISHGMWLLIQHPEQMKKLLNNLELVPNFVEETLRYETPVQSLNRATTEDVEIRGFKIPKANSVMVRYGALNRDEDVFENPEVFDIERENAARHMAFGAGAHHCIGAMLARAEMETAFRCFFSRIKNVELEKPLAEVPHHPSIWLRQLKELPITFTKI
tara:strand:+ start:5341 stop:6585 length:1245 start_codon:yes stop_codon:yes gene_type:complete